MERYTTTITIHVEFDADSPADAIAVADQITDRVTIPAPSGRAAEMTGIWACTINTKPYQEA